MLAASCALLVGRPAFADEATEGSAPRYALWTGARASWLAFGYRVWETPGGAAETTGQWLKDGVAPQLDIGARLARRYVPYLFWEHGFVQNGHHFADTSATTSTNFFGGGVRYLAGDVDGLSPLLDLSVGKRSIRVSNAGQTFTMSGVEFFRIGLGAEQRLTSHMTVSALVSFSTGSMSETDGDITLVHGTTTSPAYANGKRIDRQRVYATFTIGAALHFDLFGK